MKLLKNKTFIGVIAIIFGLVICFLLTPLYNASIEAKTKIIRVKKDIQKGQLITNDLVEVVEVGKHNLPSTIVLTSDEVVGKYANTDLYKDEYILRSKISNESIMKNNYLENLEGDDEKAISITLQSFAAGLSGKLLSGDIISIIITDTSDNTTRIPLELQYVKVLATTTSAGNDVDHTIKDKDDDNSIAVTVTLLVNGEQANILSNYEITQKIHIALVYRGLQSKCDQLLSIQNEIIEQLKLLDENQEETYEEGLEEEGEISG